MTLDNFRKINITLNKANQHILEPQIAKVGDVNGRELVVQLIDGGVIKDQTGVTLKLNWQHANGNQGSETFSALDAQQGLFSVYYPDNMLYRGTVTANISINENSKITNSLNFQIAVQGNVFDGSAVEVDGILFTLKDLKDQLNERNSNIVDLENRQTLVESQFNSLQQEITDKDITSAPEIIAARGDELTLSDRLDKEQQEVEAQLAQLVAKSKPTQHERRIITIDTDDGKLEDYTFLFPWLQERGIPATMAIPPADIGRDGYMSWEQIKELVNDYGWSVGSHTINQVRLATVSLSEVDRQCRESKAMLEEQGLKATYISYPNGSYNDDVMKIAKRYYDTGSTTSDGANLPPVKSMALYRLSLGALSVETIKLRIDYAIANNGWVIIYTHSKEFKDDPSLQDKLDQVINYAKSRNIEFKNHDDAWDIYSNVIDVGLYGSENMPNNFQVASTGDFRVNGLRNDDYIKYAGYILKGEHNPILDKPLTSYPENKIIYENVPNNYALFPEGSAGALMTHNLTNWAGYPYQEYHVIATNNYYRRFWNGSKWSPFEIMNGLTKGQPNIKVTDSISSFSKNKITITQISGEGSAGFPENKSGQLITNNMIEWAGYPYQEYHVLGENRVYRRVWMQSGWTEFKLVQGSIEGVGKVGSYSGFTIPFSTKLPHTNYQVLVTTSWNAGAVWVPKADKTTSSFKVFWEVNPAVEGEFAWKIVGI